MTTDNTQLTSPTDAELDQLDAAHKAATPGEGEKWITHSPLADWGMPKQIEVWRNPDPQSDRDCVAIFPSIQPAAISPDVESVNYARAQIGASNLLCDAHNLSLRLTAEIRRLRGERKALREALAESAAPYIALTQDAQSRKWIAPSIWEAMEQARDNALAALSVPIEHEEATQ